MLFGVSARIYGLLLNRYSIVYLKEEINDTNIFCQGDKLPNLVYLSGYRHEFYLKQNFSLLITLCCDYFSKVYLVLKKEQNTCNMSDLTTPYYYKIVLFNSFSRRSYFTFQFFLKAYGERDFLHSLLGHLSLGHGNVTFNNVTMMILNIYGIHPLNYYFRVHLCVMLFDLQPLQPARDWTHKEYKNKTKLI